jgi:hypothetical protein
MTENTPPDNQEMENEHAKRDAETQMVLGGFIVFISIPVLLGTIWAVRPHAIVVNIIAGSVLCLVGVVLFVIGNKGRKRLR